MKKNFTQKNEGNFHCKFGLFWSSGSSLNGMVWMVDLKSQNLKITISMYIKCLTQTSSLQTVPIQV